MPSNVSPLTEEGMVTLDMVHRFAYCPRLFHLMYIDGQWADNAYTVEGRAVHRRVDQIDHVLPDADGDVDADIEDDQGNQQVDRKTTRTTAEGSVEKTSGGGGEGGGGRKGDEPPRISRSVPLSSELLGITAKLDLVSTADDDAGDAEALPVDTKRGRVPNNAERSWEPERVQLMAQGLLLREAGYRCSSGVLYFAGSRTRVSVPFTDELESRTRQLIELTHAASRQTRLPRPLEDSPKCFGCSLNSICMPDETLALQALAESQLDDPPPPPPPPPESAAKKMVGQEKPIRRFYPARTHATPLYVLEQGAKVGKRNSRLVVSKFNEVLAEARLKDVSQLVLCGGVQVTSQTVALLCEAGVPIVYVSTGHWFHGLTHGLGLRNAYDRAEQFRTADNPQRCVGFARQLVVDKAVNQRSLLRRNARLTEPKDRTLADLQDLIDRIPKAASLESLLGLEGNAAALYFGRFNHMLKGEGCDTDFDFQHRNRRPPRDPVNALLSFGYAMLAKECTVALLAEGLDPYWGFYHQPRHGRPSLALDLMEPFRPTVVDSAVLSAINTGMVRRRHFTRSPSGCLMQPAGRKGFIRAYESRLDQLVTHPIFDTRCSWRSVIRLQARLLARWLRGDIPTYTTLTVR